MTRHLWLLLALSLASCFAMETRSWGEWSPAGLAAAAPAASFRWDDWPGMVAAIDGHSEVVSGYRRARLPPGAHAIEYRNQVHDFGEISGVMQLDLVAGRAYEFHFDTCYWCSPRRYAVWVEDAATGALVGGKPRDWPRWWL